MIVVEVEVKVRMLVIDDDVVVKDVVVVAVLLVVVAEVPVAVVKVTVLVEKVLPPPHPQQACPAWYVVENPVADAD